MAFLMLSLQPHATYLLLRRIREGIERTQTLKNIIHTDTIQITILNLILPVQISNNKKNNNILNVYLIFTRISLTVRTCVRVDENCENIYE